MTRRCAGGMWACLQPGRRSTWRPLTGVSMFTKAQPGKLTKQDIHRYAFFTHATLMAAEVVLGFFTSDALSKGNHDLMIGLGAAHAAIGLAIPAVMLTAGLENLLLKE